MTTGTIKTICGILATIISIIAFIPYLKDVFKRKTHPHIYTWLIWTILQITGVVIMLHTGAGISGTLALAIGAVFCGYLSVISLKYGTKNITLFDTSCLIGALAATGVYFLLHDPILSVILITIIDFVGFMPTLRKAYVEPYSETLSLFLLGTVWSALNIVAISTYSITTTMYPACILVANTICWCMLLIRRRKVPQA